MNRILIIITATSFLVRLSGFGRNSLCGVGAVANFEEKMKVWIFELFLQNPFPEGNTLFKFHFASWNWKQISCKNYSLKGLAFKWKSKSKLDLWMPSGGPNPKTRQECLLPIPPVGPGAPGRTPLLCPEAKLARGCPAITQYPGDCPSIVGAPQVFWIAPQLAEPGEARPQPLAQPPAGAWSSTSRPQQ